MNKKMLLMALGRGRLSRILDISPRGAVLDKMVALCKTKKKRFH